MNYEIVIVVIAEEGDHQYIHGVFNSRASAIAHIKDCGSKTAHYRFSEEFLITDWDKRMRTILKNNEVKGS